MAITKDQIHEDFIALKKMLGSTAVQLEYLPPGIQGVNLPGSPIPNTGRNARR